MTKADRSKVGRKSRNKGNGNERAVAKLFQEWWGSEFARVPSSGGWATKKKRDDFGAVGDVITDDDSFPFCLELKKVEGWGLEQLLTADKCIIYDWWKQTVGETPEYKEPMLIIGKNNQKRLVIVRSTYLLELSTDHEIEESSWLRARKAFMLLQHAEVGDLIIFTLDDLLNSPKEFFRNRKDVVRSYLLQQKQEVKNEKVKP